MISLAFARQDHTEQTILLRFLRWMVDYVLFIALGGYPEKFMQIWRPGRISPCGQVKTAKRLSGPRWQKANTPGAAIT